MLDDVVVLGRKRAFARTIGQAAIAGMLANPAFASVLPTCLSFDDVTEYAAADDMALTVEKPHASQISLSAISVSSTDSRCP